MWEIIISNLVSFQTGIALMVGVVGGMAIGVLPGLNATMAVSLLLPVTFSMEPYAGFIMLMAIYTAAFYGGSISAILIRTPGTPSSAATAIDGYELTKQGRGLEAIGMATVASMIGGALSGIALLTIAPLLAKVSLLFSAPEYFLIAIFGLTVIGGLSGGSMVKGFLMGAFGLFLGTIGLDGITGQFRFTFGSDFLSSGISLVPALIGMFSISQVLVQAEDYVRIVNPVKVEDNTATLKGKFLPSLKDLWRFIPNFIRSAVIGIFVGILPGAGGDIGAWLAYSEAKKASKNPECFGHGSMEAVCASETANNAVTGGSVIPLITLGIPGSAVASVLLGGFLVHGMVPGSQMFTKMAATTYTIIVGFIISNVLMGIVGVLIARHIVKVTKLPVSLLSPGIVVLSVVGSYAINTSMNDVYLMLVFGFIGYLMRKLDLPSAPAILGLLLGPMAENGFMNALVMAKGNTLAYYCSRPLSLLIIVFIVFTIAWPFVSDALKKRKAAKA